MRTLDPLRAKNDALDRAIRSMKESTPGRDRNLLQQLDEYFQRGELKRKTREDYLAKARAILRSTEKTPGEWTVQDLPELIEQWNDYSAVARNTARAVLRHMLKCFRRPELLRLCRIEPEEALTAEEMAVAQVLRCEQPKSKGLKRTVAPDWTEITEMHMRGLTAYAHPNLATLLWALWDTGARPDDLMTMKLRDVRFYGENIVLVVEEDTKTGSRPVPVNYSLGVFKRYMASHPYRERDNSGEWANPEVALFLNTRWHAWNSNSLGSAFIELKKRIFVAQRKKEWAFPKVPENISLRLLRPNAVSRDRAAGMAAETSAMIRGHDLQIMREFYDHADKAKIAVRAIVEMRGQEWEEVEHAQDPWLDCPKCHIPNAPGTEYCSNCGDPISPDAIRRAQEQEQRRQDEHAKEALLQNAAILEQLARMEARMKEFEEKIRRTEGA